jgi:hypothetical protein
MKGPASREGGTIWPRGEAKGGRARLSRTEQARDRRIGALRRWIVDAVGRANS